VLALGLVVTATALAIVLRNGSQPAGEAGSPSAASPDVARLRAAIPPAIRPTCKQIDWGPESALATMTCSGEGLAVDYSLFGSDSLMTAWYELGREEAKIEPGSGGCSREEFRGEAAYVAQAKSLGRYFCVLDDREPTLVWTDKRATIGGKTNFYDVSPNGHRSEPEAIDSLLRQWNCCLQLEP
jgi:hypothetical protein